jgi:WD40 repeat protein
MWVQKVPGGGVDALAFAPDGRTLYTLDGGGWLTAWDVAARAGRRLAHGLYRRYDLARLYVLADGRVVVRADAFSVLDPAGVLLRQSEPPGLGNNSYAHVRPDGRVYYSRDRQRSAAAWNLGTGAPEPGFDVPDEVPLLSFVRNFELSPDGRSVVVVLDHHGPAVLFGLADDRTLRDLVPVAGVGPVHRARFSPDGHTLVTTTVTPARLAVWDIPTRTVRAKGVAFSPTRGLFAFNPVYPLFAALREDEALAVWRLEDGRPVRALDFALGRYVRCVAFSPDGLTCAVGGSNKQFAVFDVDL